MAYNCSNCGKNCCAAVRKYLLGEAQRRAEGIEGEDSLKEAKKLKLGDVDPTTETKPASPDPIVWMKMIPSS
uniref:Uncharacterized protein n=1 Tax=Meloidogyne incognita TaxID=6306 RepID=A0A914KUQ7_MELIC